MDFDLQHTGQSHYFLKTWNDPTVNTNILPQAVSRKKTPEVQILTRVLKVNFGKSGTQFGVYIRYFDVIPVAISMTIRSGLD